MSPITEDQSRASIFAHLDRGRNAEAWESRLPRGEGVGPSCKNFGWASATFDLVFSMDADESWAARLLRRGFVYLLGFGELRAFHDRQRIRSADAVWTHTEKEHAAIAALKAVLIVPISVPVFAPWI